MRSESGYWLVERKPDEFDSVKAPHAYLDAGVLSFHEEEFGEGGVVLILAPGQWITACPEER